MTTHLTVRMAWHDNEWNGRVCEDPESNRYCSGTHSLLSARIERRKNVELEKDNAGKKIDECKDYTPPCFWSCNAFSRHKYEIKHVHPFKKVKVEPINETLRPYSVYTWPFRLSFNHSKKIKKVWGTYPPPKVLKKRIDGFFSRLEEGKTIIFFYLNYDNPISANEQRPKYVLLGCSVLTDIGAMPHYQFDDEELSHLRRSSKNMKNFPTLRWAVQLTHDFKKSGILLPYRQYLKRIEEFKEVSFKERIEPLDKLFTMFFLFSPIVIGIATSLGMDLKLLWIPMIMFFVWALYIYQYRGNYQLYKEKELSLIERARGLTFFFGSIVTFILNGSVAFYPTWQNVAIVIVSVGISLKVIEIGIPRTFFSEQTALFDNQQKETFRRVLSLVGSVSIYYSTMVAMFNLLMYQNVGLLTNIVALSILSFPITVVYRRERQSRRLAEKLAISLEDTRWLRRYEGQRKRKERRLKKASN